MMTMMILDSSDFQGYIIIFVAFYLRLWYFFSEYHMTIRLLRHYPLCYCDVICSM
jgi:hypothetical protein